MLDAALDMDSSARSTWLAGIEGTEPELALLLRRLIKRLDQRTALDLMA